LLKWIQKKNHTWHLILEGMINIINLAFLLGPYTGSVIRLDQRCPTFSLIGQKIEENDLGGQIFLKNIVNLKKC
jgi:hypothetical protein